jgi:hypothetical protein
MYNEYMKKFGVLGIFLLLFCLSFQKTEAQNAINPIDISGLVNIILSPETPGPYQEVTAKIEASGLDLNSSKITWKIDGVVLQNGLGQKSTVFSTGEIGNRSTISATIDSSAGTFSKSVTVYPSEIDFLWQGETYTPPFYKGRSLWTSQSTLTLVAIPHVTASTGNGERSPSTLIYRWSQNGKVLGSLSGKGQNSLVITDSILSIPQNIKLEILSDQNKLLSRSSIVLTPTRPSLVIYEKNPLYGISFHKEVGSEYQMRGKETTFTTYPLFFGVKDRNSSVINYLWRTNTGIVNAEHTVTYRTPENAEGSSQINVNTSNTDKVLQTGQKSFLIKFGDSR